MCSHAFLNEKLCAIGRKLEVQNGQSCVKVCALIRMGSARKRASLMTAPCHPLTESFGLKVSSWVVAGQSCCLVQDQVEV